MQWISPSAATPELFHSKRLGELNYDRTGFSHQRAGRNRFLRAGDQGRRIALLLQTTAAQLKGIEFWCSVDRPS
ncbi:hypothetical protein NXT3_PB00310 (plasmid) [Sinorhizobium fredii]|uniref:Uncharacterized protein n=1 Tax=Rhizobium fredii TaxID=380 RepID=A0A2L0HBX5_RHIFR|nr:hypothetical protein NXT3_PB00310 [Sinorhizobium fredii]